MIAEFVSMSSSACSQVRHPFACLTRPAQVDATPVGGVHVLQAKGRKAAGGGNRPGNPFEFLQLLSSLTKRW